MNLFNEVMNVAKKSAMNMYNNTGNNGKEDKLRGQLHACTYPDQAKFMIQKAIKNVFHVYPFFETDILSFKQNNQQKRFIELKAILQIDVRGKKCKVDYNMMIPNGFPKKAPYVRIINRNTEFIVDDFYKPLQSPNDPKSYILNEKLGEIRTWDPSKSIVNVIIESYDLLRNRFPFSKPGTQNSTMNSGWGKQQSPWQAFNTNQQSNYYNNNQGFNNYMNQGYNNQGMNVGNMGMGGFNQPQNMNKPPIPFNANNVTQTIASAQKFVGTNRKTLDNMKAQHTKALQSVQALDVLRYSIQSQENYLRKENIEMNNFLAENQNSQPTDSLVNLVKPKDQLSEQILDLISSIKARQDCTTQLEMKFNDEEISLDQFMKHVRKMQENKFEEKVLLAKCISASQRY